MAVFFRVLPRISIERTTGSPARNRRRNNSVNLARLLFTTRSPNTGIWNYYSATSNVYYEAMPTLHGYIWDCFVKAFERIGVKVAADAANAPDLGIAFTSISAQEMVFDAHNRAFAFFGGVPLRMVYDNLKTVVEAIFAGKERQFNRRFLTLANHYLFDMNRDWVTQTQVETRDRIKVGLDYHPQVVTDLHEMIAAVIRSALVDEALQAGLRTLLDEMRQRLARLEERHEKKRMLALEAMNEVGLKKLEQPDFTASTRTGSPSLVVLAEEIIPEAYWVPQPPKLDRQYLLAELKRGCEVSGVQLGNPKPTLAVRTK